MMNAIPDRVGCGAIAPQPQLLNKAGAPVGAKDYGDVLVWPATDPSDGSYFFLPLFPLISERPDTLPHVGLMDPEGRAFFYATAQLAVHPERLEQIRSALATKSDPVPHLSPAQIDADAVEVVLLQDGEEVILDARRPAPHAPHTAMLQFSVPVDARPKVLAAMQGHRGHLILRYQAKHQIPVTTEYRLAGQFPAHVSETTIRQALYNGALELMPEADTVETLRKIIAEVVALAPLACGQGAVTLSLTSTAPHPFTAELDLGSRMADFLPINDPLPPL